jgi:acyl carrier protein
LQLGLAHEFVILYYYEIVMRKTFMTSALENSILSKVIDAIERTIFLRDVQVTADTRFVEDLGLDSLDVTEIVLQIEELFGMEFSPDAISRFSRVADMVRYLSHRFFSDSSDCELLQSA